MLFRQEQYQYLFWYYLYLLTYLRKVNGAFFTAKQSTHNFPFSGNVQEHHSCTIFTL